MHIQLYERISNPFIQLVDRTGLSANIDIRGSQCLPTSTIDPLANLRSSISGFPGNFIRYRQRPWRHPYATIGILCYSNTPPQINRVNTLPTTHTGTRRLHYLPVETTNPSQRIQQDLRSQRPGNTDNHRRFGTGPHIPRHNLVPSTHRRIR